MTDESETSQTAAIVCPADSREPGAVISTRPLLLDLFCGAGGASVGYRRAGFRVIGVDIDPQRHYPFQFCQMDALDVLDGVLHALDSVPWLAHIAAIHASPPCQRYSAMSTCRPGLADEYPDLVGPVRDLLIETGLPYVIENVPGSPLVDPTTLCGTMFGRELYRHRLFEANFDLPEPKHPEHVMPASKAGHWTPGTVMSVAGHFAPVAHGRKVMDIDWMNREEMAEAIPPYYTQYVATHLLTAIETAEVAA